MRKWVLGSVLALSIGVAGLASAGAALYHDDFGSDTFGYNGQSQGWGSSDFGDAFWFPDKGFLASGNSDAPHEKFIWLTGDAKWADVAVSTGVKVDQGTGSAGIILRAKDNKTYYEFRFTSGAPGLSEQEKAAGIWNPLGSPSYRIFKYVDGVPQLLAGVVSSSLFTLPGMQNGGTYDDKVLEFKFAAQGSQLTGYVKVPGGDFTPVVTAQDSQLTSGQVGLDHWEYEPFFDYFNVDQQP